MNKIALDQTRDDSGADRHRLELLCNPPAYVQSATYEERCGDRATLPSHVYALPSKQLYPCHAKAATWLSAAFLEDVKPHLSAADYGDAKRNITKAAAFHGISEDIETLRAHMAADVPAPLEKLADDYFALVQTLPDGKTAFREYPLRNPDEIRAAAAWFSKEARAFRYPVRQQMAHRILTRAETEKVAMAEEAFLTKTAGIGACPREDLAAAWSRRSQLTQKTHADMSKAAAEMAEAVKVSSALLFDPEQRLKLAVQMDEFDHYTGIASLYGKGLDYPEDTMFQVNGKMAQALVEGTLTLATGRVYDKASLSNLSAEYVGRWLGTKVAADTTLLGDWLDPNKLANYAETLKGPEAVMFDRMMSAAGLAPMATIKTSQARRRFSEDELRMLAAVRR